MKLKFSALLFLFEMLLFSLNIQAVDVKTLQLNGLEIDVPQNYQINSHIIDGVLQTSFRHEGGSLTSQLIVSVANVGYTMNCDDLKNELAGIQESFRTSGFNVEPLSECQIKSLNGFRTKGDGIMMNHPVNVSIKIFTLGEYYIQFLECYGDDFSNEYELIEQSIRISTKKDVSGIRTICEDTLCFTYDANRILAVSNNQNDKVTFTFTCTEAYSGYSFLEYNFLPITVDNFYAYSIDWFKKMEKMFSLYFSEYDFSSMEKVTFLGQPGYMKKGVATIVNTNTKVLFTIRICRYNGKFTWSAKQLTLVDNSHPTEEIEQLFNDIETSLTYTSK